MQIVVMEKCPKKCVPRVSAAEMNIHIRKLVKEIDFGNSS